MEDHFHEIVVTKGSSEIRVHRSNRRPANKFLFHHFNRPAESREPFHARVSKLGLIGKLLRAQNKHFPPLCPTLLNYVRRAVGAHGPGDICLPRVAREAATELEVLLPVVHARERARARFLSVSEANGFDASTHSCIRAENSTSPRPDLCTGARLCMPAIAANELNLRHLDATQHPEGSSLYRTSLSRYYTIQRGGLFIPRWDTMFLASFALSAHSAG